MMMTMVNGQIFVDGQPVGGGAPPVTSECGRLGGPQSFDAYMIAHAPPFPYDSSSPVTRAVDAWNGRRVRVLFTPESDGGAWAEGAVVGLRQFNSGPFHGGTRWCLTVRFDDPAAPPNPLPVGRMVPTDGDGDGDGDGPATWFEAEMFRVDVDVGGTLGALGASNAARARPSFRWSGPATPAWDPEDEGGAGGEGAIPDNVRAHHEAQLADDVAWPADLAAFFDGAAEGDGRAWKAWLPEGDAEATLTPLRAAAAAFFDDAEDKEDVFCQAVNVLLADGVLQPWRLRRKLLVVPVRFFGDHIRNFVKREPVLVMDTWMRGVRDREDVVAGLSNTSWRKSMLLAMGERHEEFERFRAAIPCYEATVALMKDVAGDLPKEDTLYRQIGKDLGNLALACKRAGLLRRALRCYTEAVGYHPGDARLANNIGVCARELAAWTGTAGTYEAANAGEVEGEPVDEFAS